MKILTKLLPFFALSLIVACQSPIEKVENKTLKVSLISKADLKNIVVSYVLYDTGKGNTSVAFDHKDIYKWSGASPYTHESWGYFTPKGVEIPYIKRDRDLGQTFLYAGEAGKMLKSITVMVSYGNQAVRPGMYGKNISLQIFKVTGVPIFSNNGTDSTMEALHGFPHNRPGDRIAHERDDYFYNETFQSLKILRGGTFPTKKDFGFDEKAAVSPDAPELKGRYMRFELPDSAQFELQPNTTYAFVVMIDELCVECGFALANNYYGGYDGGHGIRRDGDGRFPPVPADVTKDFEDPANRAAYESAHFPADMEKRSAIPPGTNGYPDVDTWRDLTFFIEAEAKK